MMFNPCCCNQCLLLSDDFNRADSSSVGANWNEVSGSWEIASNVLKATASNSVIEKATPGNCDIIRFNVKAQTNGDEVIISLSGGTTIKFTFGTSPEIRLGGAINETYVDNVTLSTNTWYEIEYYGSGMVVIDSSIVWNVKSLQNNNPLCQLQTGTVGTYIEFDDFYAGLCPLSPNCDSLPQKQCGKTINCDWFLSFDMPDEVTVEITGAGSDGAGNDYTAMNGTYVLTNNYNTAYSTCCYSIEGLSKAITYGGGATPATITRLTFTPSYSPIFNRALAIGYATGTTSDPDDNCGFESVIPGFAPERLIVAPLWTNLDPAAKNANTNPSSGISDSTRAYLGTATVSY